MACESQAEFRPMRRTEVPTTHHPALDPGPRRNTTVVTARAIPKAILTSPARANVVEKNSRKGTEPFSSARASGWNPRMRV